MKYHWSSHLGPQPSLYLDLDRVLLLCKVLPSSEVPVLVLLPAVGLLWLVIAKD